MFSFPSTGSSHQDSIEKAINITSFSTSEEKLIAAPVPSDTSANRVEPVSGGDKDKDNGSDLRADTEEYPAGWNFALEIPRSHYRPPVELPAEPTGRGVNRHVYFVSTDLADEWVELPPATPHQINVTRRIKKFLSGSLDEAVTSYPSFPGTERNYLRAMIARISAGSHIAPRGFYKAGEEGADDDDASERDDDDTSLSEFTFTILKLLFASSATAKSGRAFGSGEKKLLNKIKLLKSLQQL